MEKKYKGVEKREFLRYQYEKPIHYSVVTTPGESTPFASTLIDAVSKNLSASGLLFTTKAVPELSSIVILNLDYRTSRICQEIEEHALIVNDRLLGKVVRIEDNDNGECNVGVAFIKKSDYLSKDIKDLVK